MFRIKKIHLKCSFARLFRASLVIIVRFGKDGKGHILLEVKLVRNQTTCTFQTCYIEESLISFKKCLTGHCLQIL